MAKFDSSNNQVDPIAAPVAPAQVRTPDFTGLINLITPSNASIKASAKAKSNASSSALLGQHVQGYQDRMAQLDRDGSTSNIAIREANSSSVQNYILDATKSGIDPAEMTRGITSLKAAQEASDQFHVTNKAGITQITDADGGVSFIVGENYMERLDVNERASRTEAMQLRDAQLSKSNPEQAELERQQRLQFQYDTSQFGAQAASTKAQTEVLTGDRELTQNLNTKQLNSYRGTIWSAIQNQAKNMGASVKDGSMTPEQFTNNIVSAYSAVMNDDPNVVENFEKMGVSSVKEFTSNKQAILEMAQGYAKSFDPKVKLTREAAIARLTWDLFVDNAKNNAAPEIKYLRANAKDAEGMMVSRILVDSGLAPTGIMLALSKQKSVRDFAPLMSVFGESNASDEDLTKAFVFAEQALINMQGGYTKVGGDGESLPVVPVEQMMAIISVIKETPAYKERLSEEDRNRIDKRINSLKEIYKADPQGSQFLEEAVKSETEAGWFKSFLNGFSSSEG